MNISGREDRAAQQCNMLSSQCSIFRNCLLTGPIPVFIGRPIKFSYEPQTKTKTNKQTEKKKKIKIKTEQLTSWYKPCFRTIPEYSPTCYTALMRTPVPSTFSVEKTWNPLENTPRQRQSTRQHRTKTKERQRLTQNILEKVLVNHD